MKKFICLLVLLFAGSAAAQSQDCTIKYLGVGEGQNEEGEPSVSIDPDYFMGVTERINASYATTNTFRLYSIDATRSGGHLSRVVNVFEFTCVTPE